MSFLKAVRDHYGEQDDAPKPVGPMPSVEAGDLTAYVGTVCHGVATATEGTRNATLNQAAYTLGRIVGAGQLDYFVAAQALTDAAKATGLEPDEIGPTVRSGLKAGETKPRALDSREATPPVTVLDANPDDPDGLATKVHEHLPLLDWHALWADETEEEWIVEPLLPARRLVALYSPPKVGKSLLMLEIAAAVATGKPVLGTTPAQQRVLYVDFENDPKGDIRGRLQAMGYAPDQLGDLCYLSFPNLAALDSDRGGRELVAAAQVYGCNVIVIDTVSRAVVGEENENDTWLDFYRHTGLRLKQAQISLIRLDHTGKDETKGQRGGSAKSGDVDAIWRLSRVTDTTYRLDLDGGRMPIAEKTLTIHREQLPTLHHRVDALGRSAAISAETDAAVAALDALGVDPGLGRDQVRKLLKGTGQRFGNAALGEAIKVRRLGFHNRTICPGQVEAESPSAPVPDRSRTGADDD